MVGVGSWAFLGHSGVFYPYNVEAAVEAQVRPFIMMGPCSSTARRNTFEYHTNNTQCWEILS